MISPIQPFIDIQAQKLFLLHDVQPSTDTTELTKNSTLSIKQIRKCARCHRNDP